VNVSLLLKFLENSTAEVIVIENISAEIFTKINKNRDFAKRDLKVTYDQDSKRLQADYIQHANLETRDASSPVGRGRVEGFALTGLRG
jgi:hypothetical protein